MPHDTVMRVRPVRVEGPKADRRLPHIEGDATSYRLGRPPAARFSARTASLGPGTKAAMASIASPGVVTGGLWRSP
jgi:hypothetical protein